MNKIESTKLKFLFIPLSVIFLTIFYFALRGEIEIPQVIELGPLQLRMYSLMILTGILVSGYLIDRYKKKHKELKKVEVDSALLWAVVPGIILARLWYVAIFWSAYSSDPIRALHIWEGGLSIFGALIGGMLGVWIYARRHKFPFLKMTELAIVFVPLGQIFGRFGNFINQELYGPGTDLPWGMYVRATGTYHHPAFLYEQIGNLILFGVLFFVYRKKGLESNGRLIAIYMAGYGAVRFTVDIFRNDTRVWNGLTIAQIVVLIMIAAGLLWLAVLKWKEAK